jgi:predicted GNAT superfamily acetyltransferase
MIAGVSAVIRDFEETRDYEACAALQCEVWGFGPEDAVPPLHLIAMHHFGGILLGAFDRDRMVGFVCGFSGWDHGRVFHHSHMLAVLSRYRGSGLGEKLKWAQRDRVMEQGIDLVNWTFDPLQAVNANLNLNRLGAVARKYRVNLYGESKSPLHGGLPTDRFEVEWFLESERVARAREGRMSESPAWERLPRANPTERLPSGLLRSAEDPDLEIDEEAFLVEIPRNITEVMEKDRGLALDWRLKTRRLFQSYFERGFTILGFHRSESGAFYRLEREETPFD